MTESEILFERLCRERGISLKRIPEQTVRTSDYLIQFSTGPVLIEVKQLEPNAQDLEMLASLRSRGSAFGWVDMGRAKETISKAVKLQLRPHAKGKMPAIVALYDTVPLSKRLDPESIAACLYGPRTVVYNVPASPIERVTLLGTSRGPNRAATETQNTTLSAVAVLSKYGGEGAANIHVFHNIHAAIPLDSASCAEVGFRQFHFVQSEWVEWKPKPRGG